MKSSADRIIELDEKLSEKISQEVAALDEKFSRRITELDENLSDRITALDEKLSEKISREIAEVRRELSGVKVSIAKLDREMAVMKWMIATAIAGILSLVTRVFSRFKNLDSYPGQPPP